MKKTILILSILFINLNIMASESKTIRIIDNLGRYFNIEVKTEKDVVEKFEFNTKEIFNDIKKENDLIDIRPFVKPEKEIEEELPF